MDFSKLSYSQVQAMADQLNSSSTQMESLLTEIKTLFDKIGSDEVWSGTAASETKATFDKLSAKFPEFSQSVNDCYKYLLSVVENYKSVDSMVTGK
mgnify:CR=1 FL=1